MALTLAELKIILKATGTKQTKKQMADVKGELKKTETQAKKTTKSFNLMSKGFLALVAGATAFILVAKRVITVVKDLIKAFASQEQAEARLTQALKNQGFYTRENIKQLRELAKARQQVTTFGDEETLSALAMLSSFKLNTEQITKMAPLLQDLATMTAKVTGGQADLESMAKLVGLALEGQAGRLKQAGISLTDYQTQMITASNRAGKFNVLLEVMAANAGGLAVAVGETATGAVEKLGNKWGDLKEELGESILESKSFQEFISLLDTAIEKADKVLEGHEKRVDAVNLEEAAMKLLIKKEKEYIKQQQDMGKAVFNVALARQGVIRIEDEYLKKRLEIHKVDVLYAEDMKKIAEDKKISDLQEIKRTQDLQDEKDLLNRKSQDFINTLREKIQLNNASNDAEKESIEINQLRNKLEEDYLKKLDMSNLTMKEKIKLIWEGTEAINAYTESVKNAKKEAEDFARVIGGKVVVGVGAVKAEYEKNLIEQGILQGGETFENTSTTDENIDSNV